VTGSKKPEIGWHVASLRVMQGRTRPAASVKEGSMVVGDAVAVGQATAEEVAAGGALSHMVAAPS
jgi:hypothetical protein